MGGSNQFEVVMHEGRLCSESGSSLFPVTGCRPTALRRCRRANDAPPRLGVRVGD